jgi:hypothetical protein
MRRKRNGSRLFGIVSQATIAYRPAALFAFVFSSIQFLDTTGFSVLFRARFSIFAKGVLDDPGNLSV